MSSFTTEAASPTAENKTSTTHAPLNQHCKPTTVSITLPNAGPLGLVISSKNGGKSVVIDEVIPQSQAEKYGVLAGDIPISVGGVFYISYETFLQRAKDERPLIFNILRSGSYNKSSSSTNQLLSINEAAAPSRESKISLDGACETNIYINMDMVHEDIAINDAYRKLKKKELN